eukprot:11011798-Alexandrium_andersonii.AAC.1
MTVQASAAARQTRKLQKLRAYNSAPARSSFQPWHTRHVTVQIQVGERPPSGLGYPETAECLDVGCDS